MDAFLKASWVFCVCWCVGCVEHSGVIGEPSVIYQVAQALELMDQNNLDITNTFRKRLVRHVRNRIALNNIILACTVLMLQSTP